MVSKFELQLSYYVQIWTNALGKGMNPLYSPVAMGYIVLLLLFLKEVFVIRQPNKVTKLLLPPPISTLELFPYGLQTFNHHYCS